MQWQWCFLGSRAGLWFKHLPFLEHSLLSQTICEMDPSLWVLHCRAWAGDTQLLTQGGAAAAPSLHRACPGACLECTVCESKGVKLQNFYLSYGVWTSCAILKAQVSTIWGVYYFIVAPSLCMKSRMSFGFLNYDWFFFSPLILRVKHVPVVPASVSLTQENLNTEICAC